MFPNFKPKIKEVSFLAFSFMIPSLLYKYLSPLIFKHKKKGREKPIDCYLHLGLLSPSSYIPKSFSCAALLAIKNQQPIPLSTLIILASSLSSLYNLHPAALQPFPTTKNSSLVLPKKTSPLCSSLATLIHSKNQPLVPLL